MSIIYGVAIPVYQLWNFQFPEKAISIEDQISSNDEDSQENRRNSYIEYAYKLSKYESLRCSQVREFPFDKEDNVTKWKVVVGVKDEGKPLAIEDMCLIDSLKDMSVMKEEYKTLVQKILEKFPKFCEFNHDPKFYIVHEDEDSDEDSE